MGGGLVAWDREGKAVAGSAQVARLKPGLSFSVGGGGAQAHLPPLCGAWGQGVAAWVGHGAGPLAPRLHS